MSGTDELLEIRESCEDQFRADFKRIRRANPGMDDQAVRGKVYQSRPSVVDRYNYVTNILADQGVLTQPWWK